MLSEVAHSFQNEGNPSGPADGEGQKTEHITKQLSLVLFSESNTSHKFFNAHVLQKNF